MGEGAPTVSGWFEGRLLLARVLSVSLLGFTVAVLLVSRGEVDVYSGIGELYAWFGIACGIVFLLLFLSTYNEVGHYSVKQGRRVFWTAVAALVAVTVFLATAAP